PRWPPAFRPCPCICRYRPEDGNGNERRQFPARLAAYLSWVSPLRLAAANGMDDFNPVTVVQTCVGILTARHDLQIQLDGQSLAGQSQVLDQVGQADGGIERMGFAIQLDLHGTTR